MQDPHRGLGSVGNTIPDRRVPEVTAIAAPRSFHDEVVLVVPGDGTQPYARHDFLIQTFAGTSRISLSAELITAQTADIWVRAGHV